MKYGLVLFIWLLSLGVVLATQYRPIPLAQIFDESEAFVSGVVTEVSAEERNGKIWTKTTLTVSEAFNLNAPQVEVYFLGGKLNDRVMKIESVDIPVVGEQKNLFLKKVNDQYFVSNLALGEFKTTTQNGEKLFFSKAFPDLPGLKNIKLSKISELAQKKRWQFYQFEVPQKIHIKSENLPNPNKELPMVNSEAELQKKRDSAITFRFILWIMGIGLIIVLVFFSFKNKGEKQ